MEVNSDFYRYCDKVYLKFKYSEPDKLLLSSLTSNLNYFKQAIEYLKKGEWLTNTEMDNDYLYILPK